jgi:hypothetical protein
VNSGSALGLARELRLGTRTRARTPARHSDSRVNSGSGLGLARGAPNKERRGEVAFQ